MNIFEEGTEERQNQKKGKKVYIETKLVQFVKMREQYEEFQRIWKSYTSTWQMKDMQNNMHGKK